MKYVKEHLDPKSPRAVEKYKKSKRQELVRDKIGAFLHEYDKSVKQEVTDILSKYTPKVVDLKTDFLKDIKKTVSKTMI